jgi:hypothetical protein
LGRLGRHGLLHRHLYRQVEPAPFLRDVHIRAEPEGERRSVGQEWDVVIGIEEWEHIEIELIGALVFISMTYITISPSAIEKLPKLNFR